MKKIIITGCGGLVGRETTEYLLERGYNVIGIDNNMREEFFGKDGSVTTSIDSLKKLDGFEYHDVDIRDYDKLHAITRQHDYQISAIIHCAAQPSHDWAVRDVFTDFHVNTTATINLLELTRRHFSDATFIFMSTNKVYGDNPNFLDLKELDTRYELDTSDSHFDGISESFSIDHTKHSLFGCSKASADLYVQEYGRYFGMNTVVFRGGCLTGSKYRGAELHGFLNYLVKCGLEGRVYNVYGYKGKQVRDNIHSFDLASAFHEVLLNPRKGGEVYNIGGGRYSNCSLQEAVHMIEDITGKKMLLNYVEDNRIGDHIWWISDVTKFKAHYPNWEQKYDIRAILNEIITNHNQ